VKKTQREKSRPSIEKLKKRTFERIPHLWKSTEVEMVLQVQALEQIKISLEQRKTENGTW
jgi:hypothetical protein